MRFLESFRGYPAISETEAAAIQALPMDRLALGRARMFGARLRARVPPEYLAALKAFAFQSGVPLAEYIRGIVRDHILERGAGLRERGAALRALINAGKAWVIACHECVTVAGALPVKERRAELERVTPPSLALLT